LGKQHQHTFRNDVLIQLSLSLHIYLLYLLLNSYDGNDAIPATRSSTPLTRHWRTCWSMEKAVTCMRYHLRHFLHSYANEVSKSEETRKV